MDRPIHDALEKLWEELTSDIPPEGDEVKVQGACDVLNEAQVHLVEHREEQRAALGVLTPVFAQIRVLLNVSLERGHLLGHGEDAAVGVCELHEVHLRCVPRNVNQVVPRVPVAVHVVREHIAQIRSGTLRIGKRWLRLPERGDGRRPEAEVRARVRRGYEDPVSLRIAGEP